MAYTESHQSLARHPKTLRLMRRLGTSRAETIGHLHLFWWWCLDYAPDGDLTPFDNEEIAIAAEWEGDADIYASAMISAGFIDDDDAVRSVHDWPDYGGKLLARKESNKNRMRETRAAYKSSTETHGSSDVSARADDVQRTCIARAANVQSQRRVEESREENRRVEENIDGTVATDAAPKTPRGSRFSSDAELTQAWIDEAVVMSFTEEQAFTEFEEFRDYWCAVAGSKGVKLDWLATWRNHLRRHLERKSTLTSIKGGYRGKDIGLTNEELDERIRRGTA
jgi:hypothetical protein